MGTITALDDAELVIQRNISKWVNMLMTRDDLSQQQLAEMTGLSEAVISARLRNRRRWGVVDLSRLSDVFSIDMETLVRDPKEFLPMPVSGRARPLAGANGGPDSGGMPSTKWYPSSRTFPVAALAS